MKTQTQSGYLMSFEQLARFLRENGLRLNERSLVGCSLPPVRLVCGGESVVMSHDLVEKYRGTWWEVAWAEGRRPVRCDYLADSLQDALRLRPGIDTSCWCDVSDGTARFLEDIAAWEEDGYFTD